MAGAVSRWLGSIDDLSKIVQRLQRVQIENSSSFDIIRRYDSEETLFYCDPPYPHNTRGDSKAYAYEMTDEEHRKLAEIVHNIKGKVAVSGYECTLMNELYGDWKQISAPTKSCHSVKKPRTERLWINYPVENISIGISKIDSKTQLLKSEMKTPTEILNSAFDTASQSLKTGEFLMLPSEVVEQIEYICRHPQNKAGIRLLLSCLLAKVDKPNLDIRKPFKEIGGEDCYSGRSYDESYVSTFLREYDLQDVCNTTTAFLTPALRTKATPLTLEPQLIGKPPALYEAVIKIFYRIQNGEIAANDILCETIRWLVIIKREK
ncbi:DNA adenine methylase, partial [Limnoraphis robusta]